MLKEWLPYHLSGDHLNSASKASMLTLGGGYQTPTPAKPRMIVRKSTCGDVGSLRKRPCRETPRISLGSALTNISTGNRGSEPVTDFHKAAKMQKNFLLYYQDCYPFSVEETFIVNIEQMIIA